MRLYWKPADVMMCCDVDVPDVPTIQIGEGWNETEITFVDFVERHFGTADGERHPLPVRFLRNVVDDSGLEVWQFVDDGYHVVERIPFGEWRPAA